MRRAAIVLIVAIGMISTADAQTVGTSRPYMGLKWQIRSLREESYNCSGDPAEKPWRVDEVSFDRKGNETFRAYYEADGSVEHRVSNKYSSDGVQTGWSEFYGKSDFPPAGLNKHADFTLSGGRVVSVLVYKENTPEFETTFEYDERGNKIREVIDTIGCCTTTWTYKYDSRNRMIENTSDSGGLSSVQRRAYDQAGNIVEETYYDRSVLAGSIKRDFDGRRLLKETKTWRDSGTRTTINTYNKAGDLLRTQIDDASISSNTTFDYYPNGKILSKDQVTVPKVGGRRQGSEDTPNPGRVLEKYDSNGNQIERYIYDAKGSPYLTQLSSYDTQGRPIELVEKSSLGPMYSRDVVYEYDSRGNRITDRCRKTTETGEVKLFLAARKIITYYDE
jgi:antitoxin component YwqK of YwqJK toxin-antitoxin module